MAEAERYYLGVKPGRVLAWSRIELATILQKQGKPDQAMIKLDQAAASPSSGEGADSVTLGHWHLVMAEVPEALNRPGEALQHLDEAEPIFTREQNLRFLVRVHETRARCWSARGTSRRRWPASRPCPDPSCPSSSGCGNSTLQMRFEFDLSPRSWKPDPESPSQQLQAEKLKQLQERRYWQYLVLFLLLLVMGILVVHQRGRTRKMQRLAMTDELTGIHNRRQIQAKGRKWFIQAREEGKPCACCCWT